MATNTTTFGRSTDSTPQRTSVSGQTGWFTVPPGWYMKPAPNCPSEMIASPNSDFSAPVYYCKLADDMQTFAFQDMMLEKMTRQDNANALKSIV